eukprot:2620392-Rhodomonas_salina.1
MTSIAPSPVSATPDGVLSPARHPVREREEGVCVCVECVCHGGGCVCTEGADLGKEEEQEEKESE